MKRALHIVRPGAPLPAGAVAPDDVVVYTDGAPTGTVPAATIYYVWTAADTTAGASAGHDQATAAIDAAGVCDLAFRADTVIVW